MSFVRYKHGRNDGSICYQERAFHNLLRVVLSKIEEIGSFRTVKL